MFFLFFFRAALLASLILFTCDAEATASICLCCPEACWPRLLLLSLCISVHLPPSFLSRPPISPCYLLTPSLSTYPSLRAARGINISCSACPRGYTSPLYRRPIGSLLQLWPPTSQPCSGQSAPAPPSDAAGVAANSWPWWGSSSPEGCEAGGWG